MMISKALCFLLCFVLTIQTQQAFAQSIPSNEKQAQETLDGMVVLLENNYNIKIVDEGNGVLRFKSTDKKSVLNKYHNSLSYSVSEDGQSVEMTVRHYGEDYFDMIVPVAKASVTLDTELGAFSNNDNLITFQHDFEDSIKTLHHQSNMVYASTFPAVNWITLLATIGAFFAWKAWVRTPLSNPNAELYFYIGIGVQAVPIVGGWILMLTGRK